MSIRRSRSARNKSDRWNAIKAKSNRRFLVGRAPMDRDTPKELRPQEWSRYLPSCVPASRSPGVQLQMKIRSSADFADFRNPNSLLEIGGGQMRSRNGCEATAGLSKSADNTFDQVLCQNWLRLIQTRSANTQ